VIFAIQLSIILKIILKIFFAISNNSMLSDIVGLPVVTIPKSPG
jgi:hypothetical protein